MNGTISGIVFYGLGVVTGVFTPVLTGLAKENASSALDLRKKLDSALFDLDAFLKYEPRNLRNAREDFAEELATNLQRTLESQRWHCFFSLFSGYPSARRSSLELFLRLKVFLKDQRLKYAKPADSQADFGSARVSPSATGKMSAGAR